MYKNRGNSLNNGPAACEPKGVVFFKLVYILQLLERLPMDVLCRVEWVAYTVLKDSVIFFCETKVKCVKSYPS